jgi:hypothetical protein
MHAVMSVALRTEFDDRPEPIVEVIGDHGSLGLDLGSLIAGEARPQ